MDLSNQDNCPNQKESSKFCYNLCRTLKGNVTNLNISISQLTTKKRIICLPWAGHSLCSLLAHAAVGLLFDRRLPAFSLRAAFIR